MNCPKCKSKRIVTRDQVEVSWNETYRVKACQDCGYQFGTCEMEVEINNRFKREWNLYKQIKRVEDGE